MYPSSFYGVGVDAKRDIWFAACMMIKIAAWPTEQRKDEKQKQEEEEGEVVEEAA